MIGFLRGLALAAFPALLVSCPAAAAEPGASARGKIAAALQPFVKRQELAGAVTLVATKDKVLSVEAVGYADVAAKKPMTADTMFWIASQSKPITAAAVMILVDEGAISLDDPVENHLPEFSGQMVAQERDSEHVLLKKPARPITVRDVLSHMSGLPFQSLLEDPTLDRYPLEARVRSYAMTPLDAEPGSRYEYSNAGVNTAARIVEVVSGMLFEKFLDERLFKPLGMKNTTFWPSAEQAKRLAKAYGSGPDGRGLQENPIYQLHYPLTDRRERYPMPAGGLFSTAQDVARFYQMLLGGGELEGQRILSEAAVKEMTSRQTPPELDSYGLGLSVDEVSFGHAGSHSTNTTADKERGLILVWLVQHADFPGEGGNAQQTFENAARELYGVAEGAE